jgi:hypothetical protein
MNSTVTALEMDPTTSHTLEERPRSVENWALHSIPSRHSKAPINPDIEQEAPEHDIDAHAQAEPLAKTIKLKLTSCCLSFLVAGLNDGSLGALNPYIILQYGISTGFLSIIYATSFAGWGGAAVIMPVIRAYFGLRGTLMSGAVLYVLSMALRLWVCYIRDFDREADRFANRLRRIPFLL